jgi:uroporphyrin-III C-methyltransferase/precorrin-2 dehydrogenase/sirohydrochlorin ferrochelatase
MQHFPIFLALEHRKVVVCGGDEAAIAKLRLILKTTADIHVIAQEAAPEIVKWADEGRLTLTLRDVTLADLQGAALVYAAEEDATRDAKIAALAKQAGALLNIVDNLQDSEFITPAIVDRDPVTVAIGTEGAAPVLARKIKADLEERLHPQLGMMARVAKGFRKLAEALPHGRPRRDFWTAYYGKAAPRAVDGGESALRDTLDGLLDQHLNREKRDGFVSFVGAGPGDPELLTLKARKLLHEADVVIHDALVPQPILELARREALLVDVGKRGFAPSTRQDDINALLVEHAQTGAQVVRIKGGDSVVFARLDEEAEVLDAAGIDYAVVPGITAASAAAAAIGKSLTRRGRNAELRLLTGHDVAGFAEQDWRALTRPGQVAAIYMGKKAARFLQGRLLMHGGAVDTPVTFVANAGRPDQTIVASTLANMAADLDDAALSGPAITLLGLTPRTLPQDLPAPEHTPHELFEIAAE